MSVQKTIYHLRYFAKEDNFNPNPEIQITEIHGTLGDKCFSYPGHRIYNSTIDTIYSHIHSYGKVSVYVSAYASSLDILPVFKKRVYVALRDECRAIAKNYADCLNTMTDFIEKNKDIVDDSLTFETAMWWNPETKEEEAPWVDAEADPDEDDTDEA